MATPHKSEDGISLRGQVAWVGPWKVPLRSAPLGSAAAEAATTARPKRRRPREATEGRIDLTLENGLINCLFLVV